MFLRHLSYRLHGVSLAFLRNKNNLRNIFHSCSPPYLSMIASMVVRIRDPVHATRISAYIHCLRTTIRTVPTVQNTHPRMPMTISIMPSSKRRAEGAATALLVFAGFRRNEAPPRFQAGNARVFFMTSSSSGTTRRSPCRRMRRAFRQGAALLRSNQRHEHDDSRAGRRSGE